MISNFIIRTKLENLEKEKDVLRNRKAELIKLIKETGVSGQAAWKQKKGLLSKIDEESLSYRNAYAAEMTDVEKAFIDINNRIRGLHNLSESETNLALLNILKEIFTSEQLTEIRKEAERRMKGEHPFRLNFNIDEGVQAKSIAAKYKSLSKDHLNKMIEFRILLTALIEKGCDQFGDAEFLKFISPLNNLIIPLKDLEKIRKDYYL